MFEGFLLCAEGRQDLYGSVAGFRYAKQDITRFKLFGGNVEQAGKAALTAVCGVGKGAAFRSPVI